MQKQPTFISNRPVNLTENLKPKWLSKKIENTINRKLLIELQSTTE